MSLALSGMLSRSAVTAFAASSKRPFRTAAVRQMSVVTLSDSDAVAKFKTDNTKGIMYFTANWCPPCKMIKPKYKEMADKFSPEVAFGKIDVDDNSDAAADYDVSSVPTFVLFDGETDVARFSGADAAKLEALVQKLKGR